MTNLDGLAVLLFVINSAKGNGLGTQLLQVKRVVSHVACCSNDGPYNRADARGPCQRVPRASARSVRTRCRGSHPKRDTKMSRPGCASHRFSAAH
jgi:hypothetical protein